MRPSLTDAVLVVRDSVGGALQHGLETSVGASIWAHNAIAPDVLANRAIAASLVGGAVVHGTWALGRALVAPHALETRDASYHPHDAFKAGVWSVASILVGSAILERTNHPASWGGGDMAAASLIGTACLLSVTAAIYGVALAQTHSSDSTERAPLIERDRAERHTSPWLFKQMAFRLHPSPRRTGPQAAEHAEV